MSLADFSQYADDHARIFILVTPLGDTSGALYGTVVDTLQDFPPMRPPSGGGGGGCGGTSKDPLVFVRITNRLPRWAKDGQRWQHYQPYKKVAGLLAITQVHDAEDVEKVEQNFRGEYKNYKETLSGCKCVVFGSKSELNVAKLNQKTFTFVDFDNSRSFTRPELQLDHSALRSAVADLVKSMLVSLQTRIELLGKKLEGGGRLEVLMSPLDGREEENEEEAKLSRAQRAGRIYKHIADLHLLSGQLQQACDNFGLALSHLSRDPLWEGSAYEGLGVAIVMKKKQDDEFYRQKTADLVIPSNVIGIFKVPQRMLKQREILRRRGLTDTTTAPPPSSTQQQTSSSAVSNGKPPSVHHRNRPRSPPNTFANEDSLDGLDDDGMEGEIDGGGGRGGGGDEEDETSKLLQRDLVVDRFTRAEHQFRKAGVSGGVPRIELLFKFARYLVSQERHKAATEILQKIYWTAGYIDEQDKTTLYQAMARVFQSMGYRRKASLLLYWAALHVTKLATKMPDYYEFVDQAHNLLTQSLPGYKLSVSPANAVAKATNPGPLGWPQLQAILMKELVYLTQHTDQNSLLIQFSCLLLQNLHTHLNNSDLRQVVQYLETVTQAQQKKNIEISPNTQDPNRHRRLTKNLSTDNLISPLPLSGFPRICTFTPKEFPSHLRPYKTSGFVTATKGPFIVSHLHGGKKNQRRKEILWVINDSGEITMDITNPLEFELRVENMKLLWEGVNITACPSSLSLPAREKQDFTLTALPQEVGLLELIGYEHTVFGVHSKVAVKVSGNPVIRVLPALPQLRVHVLPRFHEDRNRDSSGSGSTDGSPMKRGDAQRSSVGPKVAIAMADGESCEIQFQMMCQKDPSVESLSLSVDLSTTTANHKPEDFCTMTTPTTEELNALLPFARKEHRTFSVRIVAKFPPYYRVKNDFVSSLSKQISAVSLNSSSSGVVEDGGVSFVAKKFPSNPRKLSPFRGSVKKATPNGSPAISRPFRLPGQLEELGSSLPSPTLVDSLNIEVPHIRTSSDISSLPSSAESLPAPVYNSVSPLPRKRGRGSRGVARTGSTRQNRVLGYEEEWDFDQYDQRASIRSDPGERKREVGRVLSAQSTQSSCDSTPLRKSSSLASRSDSLASGGDTELLSPPLPSSQPTREGVDFAYNHSSLPRSPRNSSSPKSPAHPRNQYRRGPGVSIKNKVISNPSDLRHHVTVLPYDITLVAKFTLNYSGGEGAKVGYHREMESYVKVKVHPSLYFDDFNVTPEQGKINLFRFTFYIHNKSEKNLFVTCSHHSEDGVSNLQSVRLMHRQKHKVCLCVRRFSLPPELQKTATESNLAQLYSDHLAKMVIVTWELEEAVVRRGVSTLDGLRLPSSLLDIIQPVPLLIGVRLNDNDDTTTIETEHFEECRVGSPVNVHITVSNSTRNVVPSAWLLVDVIEFLGHKISHELSGRMIHSGNLLQRTPQLEPGQTYHHHLSFVFFYRGHYQVQFKAYILATPHPPPPPDPSHQHQPSSSSSPLSPSSSTSSPYPQAAGAGVDQTDGNRMSQQSYIEQRVTSPILRGSLSSTGGGGSESLLEFSGKFKGPNLAPLKISQTPLKCKLTASSFEENDEEMSPSGGGRHTQTTSPIGSSLQQEIEEKLLSISEIGEIMNKGNDESNNQEQLVPEQFNPVEATNNIPGLLRRERGTRRGLMKGYSSIHKRLSSLCKRQVSGPILTLKVLELRNSSSRLST